MQFKFYETSSGRSPVEEFLLGQSSDVQAQFANTVARLLQGEMLEFPLSRNLSSIQRGLHELRLRDRTGVFRVFYFVQLRDAIYFVHAFKKKTQKLPRNEVDLTLKRIQEIQPCHGKR